MFCIFYSIIINGPAFRNFFFLLVSLHIIFCFALFYNISSKLIIKPLSVTVDYFYFFLHSLKYWDHVIIFEFLLENIFLGPLNEKTVFSEWCMYENLLMLTESKTVN